MARMDGDQHSCAAFWVKGVAETLKAGGLHVAALLDEAGLDAAALSDPDARFPTESVSLLWQLAVARSGNPANHAARRRRGVAARGARAAAGNAGERVRGPDRREGWLIARVFVV